MHFSGKSITRRIGACLMAVLTIAGGTATVFALPEISPIAHAAAVQDSGVSITTDNTDGSVRVGDTITFKIRSSYNTSVNFSFSKPDIALIKSAPTFLSADSAYEVKVRVLKSGLIRLMATTNKETVAGPRITGELWYCPRTERSNQAYVFMMSAQAAFKQLPQDVKNYLTSHGYSVTILNTAYIKDNTVGTTSMDNGFAVIKLAGLYRDPRGVLLHETGHAIFDYCTYNNTKLCKELMQLYPSIVRQYNTYRNYSTSSNYTLFNAKAIEKPHEIFADAVNFYYTRTDTFKSKYPTFYKFIDKVLNNFDAYVAPDYSNVRVHVNGTDIGALTDFSTLQLHKGDLLKIEEPCIENTNDRMTLRMSTGSSLKTAQNNSIYNKKYHSVTIKDNVGLVFYDSDDKRYAQPITTLNVFCDTFTNQSRLEKTSIMLGEKGVINLTSSNPAIPTTTTIRYKKTEAANYTYLAKESRSQQISFTPRTTGAYIIIVDMKGPDGTISSRTLILSVKTA